MASNKQANLTIVVPVYNEALSLPALLLELLEICEANHWQVIFVDDGSSDESAQILRELLPKGFVRVYRHKVNRGYGGALKTGLSQVDTPFVVTIDGDGQHRVTDIKDVYEFMIREDADMVIGARNVAQHRDWYREVGKKFIRAFTKLLVDLPIRDLNSGFKMYRTELAQRYLWLCPDSMAFSDVITLLFLNHRHLVLEHPITVRPRVGGRSTISTRTAIETMFEIFNLIMLINPLRIFLPLAFVCITLGIGWGLPIILTGRGISVGSMLAMVLGVLFFFLGLIANQLASIRLLQSELHRRRNDAESLSNGEKFGQ